MFLALTPSSLMAIIYNSSFSDFWLLLKCGITMHLFFLAYHFLNEGLPMIESLVSTSRKRNAMWQKYRKLKDKADLTEQSGEDYTWMLEISEIEKNILELVGRGKTNKEIADMLNMSVNTVKYHLKKIYKVGNLKSRKEVLKILYKKSQKL